MRFDVLSIREKPNQPNMNTKHITRIITLLGFFAISGGLVSAAAKPEQEAQTAAEHWLALIDAGKFAEGWKTAAEYLQRAAPQQQFTQSLDAVRKPLGKLVSRKLKSAKYTKTVPGAPDGEYVILQFDTSFENKKEAVETVTPMREKDGKWKISGYFIK